MNTNFAIIEAIRAELEARKDRSAWNKAVTVYALEILETIEERSNYEGHELQNRAELRDYALNGAQDWSVASWGGSYLIYDHDIAERTCNPSELKRTKGGERRPNAREEWLDVQARALFQAYNRIAKIYHNITK